MKAKKTSPKTSSRQLTKAGDEVSQTAGLAGLAVANANRWREQYNYLRGLLMQRVVTLLEYGLMGDYPELQRVYALAEISCGTYMGLVSRCLSPFSDFDWEIKQVEEDKLPPGATKAMAEAQAQTLRTAYDAVDNLQEAIEHLAYADFRGFGHIQKQRKDGQSDGPVVHLECLPTWKFSREGLFGDWFWNPGMLSTITPAQTLGENNRIGGPALPRQDFIIREVNAPIDRVGLQFFIYTKLAEKNYAGFMEIYGIPNGVVTMPAGIPKEQLVEFQAAAKAVAEGGSGAIPYGSTYTANDAPRSQDPFTPFLKYWQEQLVLAGTSGKLTMLAEKGSGTLAGNAHEDTFKDVAGGRAIKVSECFNRDFDAEELNRKHPGEPVLAYFQICSKDVVDVSSLVKDVVALAGQGYMADDGWLSEKTGYELKLNASPAVPPLPSGKPAALPPPQPGSLPADKLQNRGPALDPNAVQFSEAIAEDLRPVLAAAFTRLQDVLTIQDPALRQAKWNVIWAGLEPLRQDILKDPASARVLSQLDAHALLAGIKLAPPTPKSKSTQTAISPANA